MASIRKTLLLRLPVSVHAQLVRHAEREGISLNQLITIALTEKLVQLERDHAARPNREEPSAPQPNATHRADES